MKSSKQVLIAIIAVLIMLMPTTSLAVAFSSTEGVHGESTTEATVYDNVDFKNALDDKINLITVDGPITVTKSIIVDWDLELSGNGTISRGINYKGTLFSIQPESSLTLSGNITISGGSASICSSFVSVDGGTFTMNGGTITGNKATNGGAVCVNSGTFEMNGGTIAYNEVSNYGGAVYVNGGIFQMSDGSIEHNVAKNGGGVYVANGTFAMSNNARIADNGASNQGGGVMTNGASSFFTMDCGTISGNTALNGGGVRVDGGSSFTMDCGTISGNIAQSSLNDQNGNGGGIIVAKSSFIMNDGTIEYNVSKRGTEQSTTCGWGAGIYLLSNETASMTMFRFNGGSIENNGLSDGNNNIGGDGRQIYFRDIGCKAVFNGGIITEEYANHTFSPDGSSVCFINQVYVGNRWAVTNEAANVATIGVKTDNIGGTIDLRGNLKMSIFSTTETDECGLNVRYNSTESETVKIDNGVVSGDTAHIFIIIVVSSSGDVYVDPLSGDDDTGEGTISKPYRTLNRAYEYISYGSSDVDYRIHIFSAGIEIGETREDGTADNKVTLSNNGLYINDSLVSSIEPKSLTMVKESSEPLFTVHTELVIRGIVIDGNQIANSLFDVPSGGILTVENGAILKNNISSAVVLTGGDFILGGEIIHCGAPTGEGGAVYINGGTFTMNGGTIKDCTSKYGAAVRVLLNSAMTMNGGTIKENVSTENGSAVSCKYGSFTMNGGSITQNTAGAEENGNRNYGPNMVIGAVQVLHGAVFTMNGGTVADNTMRNTYYDRDFQIYALYGGIVEINGGIVDDVVTENSNELSGSMLVQNNVYNGFIAKFKIGSGFVGELFICGPNKDNEQTITSDGPSNGAGHAVIRYDAGYVVRVNAIVNEGYYLNCDHNGSKAVFSANNTICEEGTDGDETHLIWGSIREVRYDGDWNVTCSHINFCDGSEEITTINKYRGQAKSGDIITVAITGTQGGVIYFNGVEKELVVNGGNSVVKYEVGFGTELIYIVPPAGALSLTIPDAYSEYGVSPSNLFLTVNVINVGSVVKPRSWAATNGFEVIGSYTDITVETTWIITPAANLEVGEYTIDVTVNNSYGVVGHTQFKYVVTAPSMSIVTIAQPTYGGESVGTIVVSAGDMEIQSGASLINGTTAIISVISVTGYTVTNIRVNGEVASSGTAQVSIQVSEDITISADVVPSGEVGITVVVSDLTVGYTNISVPISVYNGTATEINLSSAVWSVSEEYSVSKHGVNNVIYAEQTDDEMFVLDISDGLSASAYSFTLVMEYYVEGSLKEASTTVTFNVIGTGFSAHLYRGDVEVLAGSTETYVVDSGELVFRVVVDDSILFAGIDSILASSISSAGIDSILASSISSAGIDEEASTLTVEFDIDRSFTGCFYVNFNICGENGGGCVGFYLQVCPASEVVTDPLVDIC